MITNDSFSLSEMFTGTHWNKKNAQISIDSETGYSYTQYFMKDMIDNGIVITVPTFLQEVDVTVSRGGYISLARTVSLTPGVQRVDAVLEPMRRVQPVSWHRASMRLFQVSKPASHSHCNQNWKRIFG